METNAPAPPARRPRRRIQLALAVLVALLALLALAPTLASGLLPARIEAAFAERYAGRLAVEGVDVGWFSRAEVRGAVLTDPGGVEVVRADAWAGSLADLLAGKVHVTVTATADLVADADGVTNLQRALAPRAGPSESGSGGGGGAGGESGLPDFSLAIRSTRISWTDARESVGTVRFEEVSGLLMSGELLHVSLEATLVHGAGEARLRAEADCGPDPADWREWVSADVELEELPTGIVDAFAGLEGALVESLGPRLALRAGLGVSGAIEVSLASEHARAEATGTYDHRGRVELAGGSFVELDRPGGLARALVGPELTGGDEPVRIETTGLDWDLDPGSGGATGGEPGRLRASAELGSWGWSPDGVERTVEGLSVRIDSGRPEGVLELSGDVVGGGPASLVVAAEDVAGWRRALAGSGGATPRSTVALELAGLPAAWAGESAGPLAEHLGERPRVSVSASLELDDGAPGSWLARLRARATARVAGDGGPAPAPIELSASVEPDSALQGKLVWRLDGSSAGALVDLRLAHAGARDAATELAVALDAFPTAILLGATDPAHPTSRLVGSALTGAARWRGDLDDGALEVALDTDRAALRLEGTMRSGVFTASVGTPPSLRLLATSTDALRSMLAADGREVRLPAELALELPELVVGVRAALDAAPEDRASALLAGTALRAKLGPERLSFGPGPAEEAGERIDVRALVLELSVRGAGEAAPADARLSAELGAGGSLAATIAVDDLAAMVAGRPASLRFESSARDVPTAALVPLAGERAPLVLGETLGLVLQGTFGPAEGEADRRLEASLRGSGFEVDARIHRDADGWRVAADDAVEGRVAWTPGACEALLGSSARPLDDGSELGFHLREASSAVRSATLVVDVPGTRFRSEAAPEVAAARLESARVVARLEEGGGAELELTGTVDGDEGALALTARIEGLAPLGRLTAMGRAPTWLVDSLAGRDGLLVQTLGPSIDLTASGSVSSTADPLIVDLRSRSAQLRFTGSLEDGRLVSVGDAPLDARLPLSPLLSERIVGPMVPLLVGLRKPEGAAPVGLTVRDFALPLDGDLRSLSGTVSLDLNEVSYEFVPGLRDLLAKIGKGGARTSTLKPLEIRIDRGVCRYEKLDVSIDGREVPLLGSFDLVDRTLDLRGEVPLASLGSGIASELDQARKYLDPNLAVPIRIEGTLTRPKLRVTNDFLKTVVEEAAKGALRKGLQDLFKRD